MAHGINFQWKSELKGCHCPQKSSQQGPLSQKGGGEFTKGVDKEKLLLAGCEIDDEINLQAAFQHFLHVGDEVGCHPCGEQVL